jgi:murein DD-endopeptidase MepM/ murein hydrolase activator NlpD
MFKFFAMRRPSYSHHRACPCFDGQTLSGKVFARCSVSYSEHFGKEAQMLPQKTAVRGRKLILRRFVAWYGLPFLGVVTTFGLLPQPGISATKHVTVEQEISLPHIEPADNIAGFWHDAVVQRGDTTTALLNRLDIADAAASQYLHHAHAARSFRRLAAGSAVQAHTDENGNLLALNFISTKGNQTQIERNGKKFVARIVPMQLEQRMFMRTGEIKTTLFAAADAAGLPEPAIAQLTSIFGSDIDFQHDLIPGDRFSVIYQVNYGNGEPVHFGHILAAEFISRGHIHRAVYFQQDSGEGDYYTQDGRSLHKPFLRSPVAYTRISSGYSTARFHPILHKWRAHRGIDFAAPMGARVRATASGIVTFAGRERGYGNLIVLKHEGRYSTAYGHLLHFARSLRPGQHVTQGQVIGYVGMTGWATGPHLHYEFRVDGKQRNPLSIPQPSVTAIDEVHMPAFQTATRSLDERLESMHNTVLAQLDQS